MEPMAMLERSAAELFGPLSAAALSAALCLAAALPLVWAAANLLKRFCPRA